LHVGLGLSAHGHEFIDGVSGDDAMHIDLAVVASLGLACGANTFQNLLVLFEIPATGEVGQDVAAILEVQPVPGAGRMGDQEGNLAGVPVAQRLRVLVQVACCSAEPLENPG